MSRKHLPAPVAALLREGTVIPAHPLALTAMRHLDRTRQCALTRYYLDAGVGGLAVGVHTTQFAIREAGLYETVLALAADEVRLWASRPVVMIAGICGQTAQAVAEARLAVNLGYHAGLLSLAAVTGGSSESSLLRHCERVAAEIPLIGFYLQAAVGGAVLSRAFWREFARIPNVVAIKVAPFNRYRTLDVIQALVEADAHERVALYTGNDDHIVLDLTLPYCVRSADREVTVRFRGGLLGHWSVWTSTAVSLFARIRQAVYTQTAVDHDLLAVDSRVTDCNSAFFDAANNFRGCIAGCHEVLRRQGLLEGIWCLDPHEGLGSGQAREIDRVYRVHRDLCDDAFVTANLQRWLS